MKKTILALALAASSASADVVTVTAHGKDFDSALISAKEQAIDQVNGAWISSETRTDGKKVQEDIAKYSGGVINSYEVLSWDGDKIVIKADVEPHKDNKVTSNEVKLSNEMKNHLEQLERDQKKLNEALNFLSDKNRAMKVVVNNIEYHPSGNGTTAVIVDTTIKWDDKWISDAKTLMKTVNKEGLTTGEWHNKVVGGVTDIMITEGNPIVGAIFGTVMWKETKTKSSPMICFGETHRGVAKQCYDTGRKLQFGYRLSINMIGIAGGKHIAYYQHNVEAKKLYENIAAGTTKSHHSFRSLDMKYLQPTLAIYEKEGYNVKYGFEIDNKKLQQIDKFDFVIQ